MPFSRIVILDNETDLLVIVRYLLSGPEKYDRKLIILLRVGRIIVYFYITYSAQEPERYNLKPELLPLFSVEQKIRMLSLLPQDLFDVSTDLILSP